MFGGREGLDRPAVEARPGIECVAFGVPAQSVEIATVGRGRERTQAPLRDEMRAEAFDPGLERGVQRRLPRRMRVQRVSAYAINSPMRKRNSVLMPGWKRSASLAPIASSPMLPFGPSGTRATEPISIVS